VVLPDRLHAILSLPADDADFPARRQRFKLWRAPTTTGNAETPDVASLIRVTLACMSFAVGLTFLPETKDRDITHI
jgi:hypothetical protein